LVDVLKEVIRLREEGKEGVLITVVEKIGSGPSRVGDKMLVKPDGSKLGTVGGGTLEQIAVKRALSILKEKKNLLEKYDLSGEGDKGAVRSSMLCGGNVSLFYEYIGTGPRVYIFGAGHVGKALVYHLRKLNYFITVIDSRKDILEDLEGAHKKILTGYEKAIEDIEIPEGSFFVITTHSHVTDYTVLKKIYEADGKPCYIGLVASPNKASTLVKRLRSELKKDIDLNILYTPVGLDIGGETPHEIAISIISEMQAVRYGKSGHHHLKMEWSSS